MWRRLASSSATPTLTWSTAAAATTTTTTSPSSSALRTCGTDLESRLEVLLRRQEAVQHPSPMAVKTGIRTVGDRQQRRQQPSSASSSSSSSSTSSSSLVSSQSFSEAMRASTSAALSAFAEACSEAGMPEMAAEKLAHYRRQWATRSPPAAGTLTGPDLYAVFLRMAADCRSPAALARILQMMSEDRVGPDPGCLAAIFVAAAGTPSGRSPSSDGSVALDLARQFAVRASRCQVDACFGEDVTRPDDRRGLLEGVRRIFDQDYVAPTAAAGGASDSCYDCRLLEGLNGRDRSSLLPALTDRPTAGDDFKERLDRQLRLEMEGTIKVSSIQLLPKEEEEEKTKTKTVNNLDATVLAQNLMEEWREVLTAALEERLERQLRHRATLPESSMTTYPYFKILPASEYVDIMLKELHRMLRWSESYSPSVTHVQNTIGCAVIENVRVKRNLAGDFHKVLEAYKAYAEGWFNHPGGEVGGWCHREAFLRLSKEKHLSRSFDWPFHVSLAMGRELLNCLMHNVTVKVDSESCLLIGDQSFSFSKDGSLLAKEVSGHLTSCPALFKVFRRRKNMKQFEEIRPLPALFRLFSADKHSELEFGAQDVPMIVPPVPWISTREGGNLLRKSKFVRIAGEGKDEASQDDRSLRPLFDSLNQLGSTPWQINGRLLDVAVDVFLNQERHGDLLSRLAVPRHQDQLSPPRLDPELQARLEGRRMTAADRKVYNHYLSERQAFSQFKAESYSLWCDALYRISIANHFRNDTLYFPHNIDFRGRVYPIASYLNHMGGDLARSLLVFAQSKPLGPRGLDWLKLHAVNLSGLKKRDPVSARLRFAEECLPAMLRSAEAPFGEGGDWWLQSEEPWQTLGACMEIRDAVESGRPEEFRSRLPVHQDGSCNGLQHYAALGRDVLGARSVNLLPSEAPQDVYSEIAAIVEEKRREDAERPGDPLRIAKLLEGFVQRKVIKQTVMTTVYGVTRYGAKLQIARQLRDRRGFPLEAVEEASVYLARKTFESLNEMFRASQEIQAWFTECANVISGDLGQTVAWRTPLGLAVNQPYVKLIKKVMPKESDEMCGVDVHLPSSSLVVSRPNVMKQRNGFPPNFVHSLDSSHMMLTSLHMWNLGLTFASVHDCYWTHACSVEEMNRVCREQFVTLHEHPVLEDLAAGFLDDLDGMEGVERTLRAKARRLFQAVPAKGELELRQVKESVYFFS